MKTTPTTRTAWPVSATPHPTSPSWTSKYRAWTGWSFCQLREKSDLPVIFLTSKDDEIDEAVSAWAPTITLSPFPAPALERIRAILRRREIVRKAEWRRRNRRERGQERTSNAGPRPPSLRLAGSPINLTVTEFLHQGPGGTAGSLKTATS